MDDASPSPLPAPADVEDALFQRIAQIIEAARGQVVRTVNTAQVHACWHVGQQIVEVEQQGRERAEYGERLLERLAQRLGQHFGRGWSVSSLLRMRNFYRTFPRGSALTPAAGEIPSTPLTESSLPEEPLAADPGPAVSGPFFPPSLGWSHYLVLLRVASSPARAFYEIEAARENWSVRELERQIGSLLYERLARSRDREGVLALAREGQQVLRAPDVLKDPVVLEFLELEERAHWRERDLEQAIIDRLESFLLELGKGFCFVARQKRLTIDGDHFYVDLVFYNRLLRCFVLVELKLGKLEHQDLGQMQMYVHYYDRQVREAWEEPTIGIILCSEKNDAVVRITLPEDNTQIHAARYQHYLPTEEALREELVTERERFEQARRLTGDP